MTVVDLKPLTNAKAMAKDLGCDHNVRFIQTTGGFAELGDERFDAVFIKSVLWGIEQLGEFLDELFVHLLPGAKVAFVENNFNASMLAMPIRKIVRGPLRHGTHYGIKRKHLPLFRQRLKDVSIRRHRYFVYEILGTRG